MTLKGNESEERLSAALRELAESSRQGPSPEVGLALKDAFRHHHARRKRILRMRITILCLCVAGLAASLLPRRPPVKTDEPVVRQIQPQKADYPAETSAPKIRRHISPRRSLPARNSPAAAEAFVGLPSLAMLPDGDELRVVRLEMTGDDLRLVGAPVPEKIVRHRVTADFVVGHDGTPYAVRLVQAKY